MVLKKMIVIGTDALLQSANQLMQRGEITPEQYREMERRNETLVSQDHKKNIIHLDQEGGKNMCMYKNDSCYDCPNKEECLENESS